MPRLYDVTLTRVDTSRVVVRGVRAASAADAKAIATDRAYARPEMYDPEGLLSEFEPYEATETEPEGE